ncbi:hypothetical protein N9H19_00885 [Flavobacteriales bacterium]|nr:hypothetical protein [Flavobacteriales bacterium]
MLYDDLKPYEETIKELIKIGVVSYTWTRDIEIFEKYQSKPEMCNECRYEWLAHQYRLTGDRIRQIVSKFKK